MPFTSRRLRMGLYLIAPLSYHPKIARLIIQKRHHITRCSQFAAILPSCCHSQPVDYQRVLQQWQNCSKNKNSGRRTTAASCPLTRAVGSYPLHSNFTRRAAFYSLNSNFTRSSVSLHFETSQQYIEFIEEFNKIENYMCFIVLY